MLTCHLQQSSPPSIYPLCVLKARTDPCVCKHTCTRTAHTKTKGRGVSTDLAECVSALLAHSPIEPESSYLW